MAAQALLMSWNGDMDAGEAEGLIFWTWYDKVTELLYKDELTDGTEEASLFNDFWSFRAGFAKNALQNDASETWCNNIETIAQETCANLVEEAMQLALEELKAKNGSKMQEWQWGKEHVTRHKHSVFTGSPLAILFDLTIPNGGDKYTVNAAGHSIKSDSFEQNFGASLRAIYDLSDLENSRFMHTTGQSGHPLSMNYRSFLRKWRDVEYVPMVTEKDGFEDKAMGALKLTP